MNKEELKKYCAELSNAELLYIVNNKIRYNVHIVTAAQIEMDYRSISKDELKQYKKEATAQARIITGNIDEELSLGEKFLFFIFFLPRLNYFVRRSYRKQQYILKLRQGSYYSILGFVFVIPACFAARLVTPVGGVIVWLVSFLPAFAFDRYYYTRKTIERLRKRTTDGQNGIEGVNIH